NVLHGGNLIQDLDNGNERHRKEQSDKQHAIVTENGTLLSNIAGTRSGNVNSAHHQAIDPDALGDNLRVNAVDDDDERIVEGLEFNDKADKGFMICVQWHPERMQGKEESPFSKNLKSCFLSAIKNASIKKLTIINPATEEVITEVAEDTQFSIQEKFNLLRRGQAQWASTVLKKRIECIQRFFD